MNPIQQGKIAPCVPYSVMNMPASPALKSKTPLASLSKSELLDRVAALPCAPKLALEDCPAEQLRIALSTHQVELEARNQSLRDTQRRVEEARDRYSDLYDFASVGYVTLDPRGCVREINLTGAAMLGKARKQLIGMTLLPWLNPECRSIFLRHLKQVFASGARVVDELRLYGDQSTPRHISLTSIVVDQGPEAGRECHTIMADITLLKETVAKLTHSRQQTGEDVRRHLGREIHDELVQKLKALRFEVTMLGMKTHPEHVTLTAACLLRQVDETIESVRALELGAASHMAWECTPEQVTQDIPKDMAGCKPITTEVADALAAAGVSTDMVIPHALLSNREFQVFRMLASGQSVNEVAQALHLSPNTISTHKSRLMRKLGVDNNAGLVRYAISHGLTL